MATIRGRGMQFLAFMVLLVATAFLARPCQAQTADAYGPAQFARTPVGAVQTFTAAFVVAQPGSPVYLDVRNGNVNNTSRLADVQIKINGVIVLNQQALAGGVPGAFVLISEAINAHAGASNRIDVVLGGNVSGFIEVRVTNSVDPAQPPPPPRVDAFDAITRLSSYTFTGSASGAAQVRVTGNTASMPGGPVTVPVVDGLFEATLPLTANRVSSLSFTSLSSTSVTSSSTPATITQDSQPPTLAIDTPAMSASITNPSVDVAGRVGDALSGFKGLTVKVNGQAAQVNIGIGANGTFFKGAVPLTTGQANTLTVEAIDSVGNSITRTVSVTQAPIPATSPRILIISGNMQTGAVHSLAPAPIVVKVCRPDGSPIPNKFVTFHITRSDGQLGPDAATPGKISFQVASGADGLARAYWRLGGDAGFGNNRLEVKSLDIAGTAEFCASTTPGPASRIHVGGGGYQRVEAGAAAPEPLTAFVNDGCNGTPGVPVTFRVTAGTGQINGLAQATVTTGPTGHAQCFLMLAPGGGNNTVEANFTGNQGQAAVFTAFGIRRSPGEPTTLSGVVLDNAERAIGGVSLTLLSGGQSIGPTLSDAGGRFFFASVPAGPGTLQVVGMTATTLGGRPLSSFAGLVFPPLNFTVQIVASAANEMSTPVLLPPLELCNTRCYNAATSTNGSTDTVLTIRRPVAAGGVVTTLACEPQIPSFRCDDLVPGLVMTIKGGSMKVIGADGRLVAAPNNTHVALNLVHFDDVPVPIPDGASSPLAWTVKPEGAFFDPPIAIQMPNMAGLPPGAAINILNFDHDTEKFQIVGSARVTDDGSMIKTDPGSGLNKSGWGGFCPPYPPTGGVDDDGDGDDDGMPGDDEENPNKKKPAAKPCDRTKQCCGDDARDGDDAADPVYLFSGEFYEDVEDLRIPGRGPDFIWSRKYRSKTGPFSAQGNGWDASYNVFLNAMGTDLLLCEGNGRKDRYKRQSNGTWTKRGFFRDIKQNPDGTLMTTFEDGGMWAFGALNGSPSSGKLITSTDRNGNSLRFSYDAQGRVSIITDTLDRPITIAYTPDGHYASVTDFTGRQVRYTYYAANEQGGSPGDLKSVTTPAVTGTPNGNDFPQGKTTVYTYTSGFSDDRLNHNLLTITDPKGQRYLTNVYASTSDPANINFDRVVRQVWGNPSDIIDLTYIKLNGDPATAQPIIRVIVNDRAGNVKEYFYNRQNVPTAMREYTGRATANQPTTETLNRPTGKLRGTDPEYYETRYEYNDRFLLTRTIFPNGASESNYYEKDINPGAPPRTEGNLRYKIRRARTEDPFFPAPALPPADQAQLTESFEYDVGMGSCCGSNFVTRHVDARNKSTFNQYDAKGNRTQTTHRIGAIVENWTYNAFGQLTSHTHPANGSASRRTDTMEYYDTGPARGYLARSIVDSSGLRLTTTYEYDAVGNVVRIIDPRGNDTLLTVNQLNQVVRRAGRTVDAGGTPVRYIQDSFYDADNNVARTDVQNTDAAGAAQPNAFFSTIYDFEILNHVTRKAEEAGAAQLPATVLSTGAIPAADAGAFILTEYGYDANRNRTLVRSGEAVNGHDPANMVALVYDERDLTLREVRAPGSPLQSSTEFSYDRNKNLRERAVGTELNPRRNYAIFDGYDRMCFRVDAMGNTTSFRYDANSNIVGESTEGELDDSTSRVEYPISCYLQGIDPNLCGRPAPPVNPVVRLREVVRLFDDMDRLTSEESKHFDAFNSPPTTQPNILDGLSTRTVEYALNSQVTRTVNDNLHASLTAYDTANRPRLMTDAKGNTVEYTYDLNSNIRVITRTDRPDLGGASQVFTTTNTYDGLDRLVQSVDNVGNTTLSAYDSRSNRIVDTDALGNRVVHSYDGLNRLTATTRELRAGGIGSGSLVGAITTRQEWDADSRLTAQIDDSGNRTEYMYDSLDRMTVERAGDGTQTSYQFDVQGNRTRSQDANGSVVLATFDLDNRPTRRDITPGAGVSPATTFETFKYDGLSRITEARDDDSTVARAFDSLGYVIRETLNGLTTSCLYDGMGNLTRCTYPSGRIVNTTYDELERKRVLTDGGGGGVPAGPVATYSYVGPDRVARRDNGNGTRADYTYDGIGGVSNAPGDFGVRRIVRTLHTVVAGGTVIDDKKYSWDRVFNKVSRIDQRAPGGGGGAGVAQTFSYDSIYRLVKSDVAAPGPGRSKTAAQMGSSPASVTDEGGGGGGGLAGAGIGGPRQLGGGGGPPAGITEYFFDGVGNRTQVTGADNPGPYTLSPATPEPADRQVNQYTSTPQDTRAYDRNGNLILVSKAGGSRTIVYDYRNRMVSMTDAAMGTSGAYAYDAFGRRIARSYNLGALGGNAGVQNVRYYYHGWQIDEERDATSAVQATYVYGNYIDEPITMRSANTSLWFHQDDMQTVDAITTLAGSVLERYTYHDFGQRAIFDSDGHTVGQSLVRNNKGFTSRETDLESNWIHVRSRMLDPMVGCFTMTDKLGIWGDMLNTGNAKTYTGHNPTSRSDPLGLVVKLCKDVARIPGNPGFKHHWIKTDKQEVGLGPRGGGEPRGSPDDIFVDTTLNDHSGRSNDPGATCEVVPDVNEKCVDKELGNTDVKGTFPFTNCQGAAKDILDKCRNPKLDGDATPIIIPILIL